MSAAAEGGLHGQGSCFMPISQIRDTELYPRMIQVAGALPGLTVEGFLAPQSEESQGYGTWQYDFSDPDGPQMGVVAMPGSELVHDMLDPVVVVVPNDVVGIELAKQSVTETLLLVDRAENEFESRKFFVYKSPEGELVVRWFDKLPAGWEPLGKVMLVTVPWLPAMGRKKTGFMEEDDDWGE